MAKQIGKDHWYWRGDEASYYAKHIWLVRHYGRASKCEKCISPIAKRFEWANISGKYKRDIKDYVQLCISCHRLMDRGNHCRNGHEFTDKNVWLRLRVDRSGVLRKIRVCLDCQKTYSRTYQLKLKNKKLCVQK